MGLDITLYLKKRTDKNTSGLGMKLQKLIQQEDEPAQILLPLGDFRKYYSLHNQIFEYYPEYENCEYLTISFDELKAMLEAILEEDKDDYEKDYDEKLKTIITYLEEEISEGNCYFDIVYWAWW